MNVDQIYQLQRDDAFAHQFSAEKYHTFVAMPFSNRGGYPEPRIRRMLLDEVHTRANSLLDAPTDTRSFSALSRVDGGTAAAVVITDQIISDILNCHFFVGDLTGCNFGVVLETGIALALKPNHRVLLFTQDDTSSLHFDLRVTNVNRYNEDNLIEKVANGLVEAASQFEKEADRYIRLLSSQLTPDAMASLSIYAQLWSNPAKATERPSLWEDVASDFSDRFKGDVGRVSLHNSVRELSQRRLVWTEHVVDKVNQQTRYGTHATKLGWRVIQHLWHWKQPPTAPTGPNAE